MNQINCTIYDKHKLVSVFPGAYKVTDDADNQRVFVLCIEEALLIKTEKA
jgi:hypothetical protein